VTEPAHVQRIAAYGLAVRSGAVLLSKILRSVRGGVGQWMLPGGGVEHGEHPAQTVAREFYEETGLTVTVGDLLYVGSDCRSVPLRAGTDVVNLHTVFSVHAITAASGVLRAEENGAMGRPAWIPLPALGHTPLLDTTKEILDNVLHRAVPPATGAPDHPNA
jgi:8-oxo-dGTP pyrophosphatase MutT (NUDIX family)